MSLAIERVCAVLAGGQGSGYLLTPRLILTAAHVLTSGNVRVAVPGGRGEVRCVVVWQGGPDDCDAALLLAEEDLVTMGLEPVHWGKITDLEPRVCQAIGFPHVQRGEAGTLDTEHLVGTLKPGAELVRGRYVVDLDHTPPRSPTNKRSPWSGMSGSALFCGYLLIGVITVDPAGWQHGRVLSLPAARLLEEPGFSSAYFRLTGMRGVFHEAPAAAMAPDADFERRYRSYVGRNYNELRIFGLDFSNATNAEWPLDTAYLSLELSADKGWSHQLRDLVEAEKARFVRLLAREPGAPSEDPKSALTGRPPVPRGLDDDFTAPSPDRSGGRQRVESALAERTRVLLRGLAGSGKTTLLQWLAVSAAQGTFAPELRALQGRIPFVLRLRSLARRSTLPSPEDFLAVEANPLHGAQPDNWADRVLSAGRGLLLIDGVDEVPEQARHRTQKWLTRLLTAYPDCVFVVTTRPSAVPEGWLDRQGFTELTLLPMNQRDVTAFVHRWHHAAAQVCQKRDEAAKLPGYRDQLLATLRRKRDLGPLATNPLMCAMICALHRDRRSFLPDSRMELYSAALTMLLVRRDKEREVLLPSDLKLPEDAQRRLLQELAYWMIRNGQTEAERTTAVGIIERLLPAMRKVARPERAPDVFRYLLLRSGLLREPTPETVDFVHRTFQDYLGAKAAVEARDLHLIASHAHDPQWEDVVRMAVGHARDDERAALLRQLLRHGAEASTKEVKARLHLLAAASLEHATTLDPEVASEVESRAAELIPPSSSYHADHLAEAGPVVLDLLPGPEGLRADQAAAVVRTAAKIGGEHALDIIRQYRDHKSREVPQALVDAWESFDIQGYAKEVLAFASLTQTRVTIADPVLLEALPAIGRVSEVHFLFSPSRPLNPTRATFDKRFSLSDLRNGLRSAQPQRVRLIGNRYFRTLDFLEECAERLRALYIESFSSPMDYSPLNTLPHLERLSFRLTPITPDLTSLEAATNLTEVDFHTRSSEPLPLDRLPLPSGLRSLSLAGMLDDRSLDAIQRWPGLVRLEIDSSSPALGPFSPGFTLAGLSGLTGLPQLRHLALSLIDLTHLCSAGSTPIPSAPVPQVSQLTLEGGVSDRIQFGGIREIFPNLSSLSCHLRTRRTVRIDCSALHDIPDLALRVFSRSRGSVRLAGAKGLPEHAVRVYDSDLYLPGRLRRARWPWRRGGFTP